MKIWHFLASSAAFASPAVASPPPSNFITAGAVADAPEGFNDMCMLDTQLCKEMGIETAKVSAPKIADDADISAARPWATGATRACRLLEPSATCANPIEPIRPEATTVASQDPFDVVALYAIKSDPAAYGFKLCSSGEIKIVRTACEISPQLLGASSAEATNISETAPLGSANAPVPSAKAAHVELSMVRHLNARVNHIVRQISDIDLYGVNELWRRPPQGKALAGDCEDIAIEKRVRLIEAGLSPDLLSFGVVYGANLGLHTVLVVHAGDGDYVLDSLTSRVKRWNETGYRWLRIESRDAPGSWHRVES